MFNFRMQTILDVRKTLEEKIIFEFSERQKELRQETETLQLLQQQKAELIDTLRNIQDQKVPIIEIAMQSAMIKRRRKEEELQKETVRNVTNRVDKKRDELLEARKKKKAMEIYKTRHFEKYQAEERIHERTTIDELVVTGHNRRAEE
jgi:flagellar export protein FliJ